MVDKISFAELAKRYCDSQVSTPQELLDTLKAQKEKFSPDGWFLAECQMLDSSYLGTLTILPYGPNNTFKEVISHPFSPRGLASDQSCAIAYILVSDLPDALPKELSDWKEPPKPLKKRRKY
jgi:hypothetical protein